MMGRDPNSETMQIGSLMEWYKKLFLIYKVCDIGIEQKPFWEKNVN